MTYPEELKTIADFIRWGASEFNRAGLFFGHGRDNPFAEAEALLLHALNLPSELPSEFINCNLGVAEKHKIADIYMQRINTRKPTAYLTNKAIFAGFEFFVDERTLIPRSPIAELIEAAFTPWVNPQRVFKILEIGTGSGCIAIASAYMFPNAKIDAIDISTEALEVCRDNIKLHGAEHIVNPIESDLFAELPAEQQYDIIISNPPYVDAVDMSNLPDEYHHEPRSALAAGEDGLDIVRRILSEAKNYLATDGILVVEVGNSKPAVEEQFSDLDLNWLEFSNGGEGVFIVQP